ncbi:MAG: DEAD/DEAH box helicase [Brevinematia bacterium]
MVGKSKILGEFGERLYNKALKKLEGAQVENIEFTSEDHSIRISGKIQDGEEVFFTEVVIDATSDNIIDFRCSCNEECEHVVMLLLSSSNQDKEEIISRMRKFNSEKRLLPLEVLLDFSHLKLLSVIRVRFDLADKKLARSPKNYIYEYIVDDVKTVKVTPEDDKFLRYLISENNVYTYPDEGISLSMSQFLRMVELIKEHPRVYIYPSHEKLIVSNKVFVPKLRVVYESVDGIKKLKIQTEEDYSDVYVIANGNEKRVLRGNELYVFDNPIPIENWLAILENKFKISEKEFPKFFGKFYELLSNSSLLKLSEEIDISKPVIVDVKDLEVKLYLDYNESIEKLYWEPIIVLKNKEVRIKDIFDVLVNHIEIDRNHFVSDLKALRQVILNELYEIGMKEYLLSLSNPSQYIPIDKESFVKKILVNYTLWKNRVELSNRTKLLVPIEVEIVFDIDISTESRTNFKFQFKVFFIEVGSKNIVKEVSVESFIKNFSSLPSSGVIEVGGRYFKITNVTEVQNILNRIKDIALDDKSESTLIRLIRILSLEDELLEDKLINVLRVRKDETVERLKADMKTMGRGIEIDIPAEIRDVIREYQKTGYYWLNFLYRNSFGGILADDMGLGKTLQALAFIKGIREFSKKFPSLVICPTSLTHNWAREIDKFFPGMRYAVVSGKPKEREEILNNYSNYDVIITSYALLRNDVEMYADREFEVVIVDEAQYIKNKEAKITKFVKLLNSRIKVALTGTPIENSVSDLWSIFDFIMPGMLGSYQTFIEKYSNPENYGELAKKISYFVLRRKKEDVLRELPSKIEQNIFVPLSPEQSEIYDRMVREIKLNILKQVGEFGFEKSKMHILSALTKLRQVCNHPYLISEDYRDIKSGKMELLMDLLDDAIEGGHKVLVFSQFVEMLKIIREEFENQGIKYSYLDGSTKNRQKVIDEFNSKDDIKVFLISLKAGGFGINLTSADIVILYDPWWNPMIERQAMDRVHRIGQTKTVNVYKLISENTIEEKILSLQESKRIIFSSVIEASSSLLSSMTWEDVKSLLE